MPRTDQRQCLWLTLDSEGQLRLYADPESNESLCVSPMLIKNFTRLPRVGEMLPIWLKLSLSAYSQSIIEEPRVHMHDACNCTPVHMHDACNCTPVQMHDACRGAGAHNACADASTDATNTAIFEETTKRETTKESSTKKEEKKKRRKEGLPSVGHTDTTETLVSAENSLRKEKKASSPRRKSSPPTPPPEAAMVARSPEEAQAAKQAFWADCVKYAGRYGLDYVTSFFGFWAETDRRGRMRWEGERFFNLANRLARWNPDRGGEMRRAIAADVRRRARAVNAEANAAREAIAADEERRRQAANAERDNAARTAVTPEQARESPEYWEARNRTEVRRPPH